jgi:hypothetical protein
MPDVEDILRSMSHPVDADPAHPEVVAGDVARGHQASSRRRRRHVFTGAFVSVAAAAVVGIVQVGMPTNNSGTVAAAPETANSVQQVKLVSYTGDQPVGFKVSTVPDGWQVRFSDRSSFVVAPPGADASPGGAAEPVSVKDAIAVSLQGLSTFPKESSVQKVDINGKTGQLGNPLDAPGKLSDTRWLFFPGGKGSNVQVQVPASVGLSDDQVIAFAEGITVTDKATAIGG